MDRKFKTFSPTLMGYSKYSVLERYRTPRDYFTPDVSENGRMSLSKLPRCRLDAKQVYD